MSITIYDIARQAGVSIATVSRALNGSARVSEKTREKVIEIAAELKYQPHASAQSLARNNSRLISAVMPAITNYFYLEVLRGLHDRILDTDYDLLVYAADNKAKFSVQLQRALQRGRSDGVLVFSTSLDDAQAERLLESGQSVVLVDATHPQFDSVSLDNQQGGYLATRHLLDLGMKRIGLITASVESIPAFERRLGYERALEESGIKIDPSLLASSGSDRENGFTEETGHACMKQLLRARPRPEAVFVASDIQALGAIRVLKEAGLQPGVDIGLIGFDDIKISEYVGLSTLRQPMYEMGRLAVEKIMLRMAEPDRATSHTVFAPKLICRDTCGKHHVHALVTESAN